MTTVIDHAIAIPMRPSSVWDMIRDISNNPTWHPDCQRVQFLTTMTNGRGTRWRNTTNNSKEQVIEVTAWYEGLGYEYRIIDGSNYPQNRGRIRLQESPEGTVVQWTFSYTINGFWGNIRNRFGMKSYMDKAVVQGLRNLYTIFKDIKSYEALNPEDSKAYLKEAPNVEERASYQPRYPSKVKSQELPKVQVDENIQFKPPTLMEEPKQPVAFAPIINEPPLSADDTKPNPSIQITETTQPNLSEPDFLKAMPEQGISASAVDIEKTSNGEAVPLADNSPVITNKPTPTPSKQKVTVEPLTLGQDISKLDTSKISVFELFGIDKPSETENVQTLPSNTLSSTIKAVIEPPRSFMDSAPIIPDIQPEVLERRRGLRAALRRRVTKIRVPKSE